MADNIFRAVQETIKQLSKDKRYLNANPGFMCALHTWGRNLSLHPHIHCLMTHGGLSAGNNWQEPKKKCLFPRKVVMMIFRGKINAFIKEALKQNELIVPPSESPQKIINLCNKLGRKEWVVHFCKRYDHGNGVVKYIAKYVRGGPLKNKQIKMSDNGQIEFSYNSHQTKQPETLVIGVNDFIKRWLNHIPVPKKQLVRRYGLYSPRAVDALNIARALHNQKAVTKPEMLVWQDYLEGKEQSNICPKSGAGLRHEEAVRFQKHAA
jgi:hypothetical protein